MKGHRAGTVRRYPALEPANTIRHDGHGGVTDDLSTVAAPSRWLGERRELVPVPAVEEDPRGEIVALRRAVRALFARAVAPEPPSSADAQRLMPVDDALAALNTTASGELVVLRIDWHPDAPPTTRLSSAGGELHARSVAALARAAIEFLTGPERVRLRSCGAARCVRYFLKGHGKQQWCTPSCGNRARVARHYHHRRPEE